MHPKLDPNTVQWGVNPNYVFSENDASSVFTPWRRLLLRPKLELMVQDLFSQAEKSDMHMILTEDHTQIYYKDWGKGSTVVFSHGWPLNSDSWRDQMLFLTSKGYRCIAHDRRGHGRSSQPRNGNDMNTYADDLAKLIKTLDLQRIVLIGFSAGGGEVARYIGRHGTKRVAKVVLISAVPPFMLKTDANPDGLPMEVFDEIRRGSSEDRAEFYAELASGPFFGANRPDANVSQELVDSFTFQGMQAGPKNTFDCIQAFSETDFTKDLKKFDVPTLIIHGDDDQIVPIDAAGRASAKIVKNSKLIVYSGAPHGLIYTHKDKLNADLLSFLTDRDGGTGEPVSTPHSVELDCAVEPKQSII
jgi:non-heme chloroperoxidase